MLTLPVDGMALPYGWLLAALRGCVGAAVTSKGCLVNG